MTLVQITLTKIKRLAEPLPLPTITEQEVRARTEDFLAGIMVGSVCSAGLLVIALHELGMLR